jgi:dinuclear metal center YbgI/SA1388 family protein
MTFYELYKALDAKFPEALRCEWDNDGIMCADDLYAPCKKVLISLDVTNEAVEYAIKNGFDTIISHHPLVFKGQKALSALNFTQNKLISLVKNGVRVMSFHTRLDAGNGGVNDALLSTLGFDKSENDPADPIGRICTLDKETTVEKFAYFVKEKLGSSAISYIGEAPVKRVYIVGGDGKDLIENAISCGADTLLTGRASYNTMIDAKDMGLNIIEAGHFFTENLVCNKIKSDVESICNENEIEIFDSFNVKII